MDQSMESTDPFLTLSHGQVIASCIYPELMDGDKMPLDVRERAKTLLECLGGSVGEKFLDIVYTVKITSHHCLVIVGKCLMVS